MGSRLALSRSATACKDTAIVTRDVGGGRRREEGVEGVERMRWWWQTEENRRREEEALPQSLLSETHAHQTT